MYNKISKGLIKELGWDTSKEFLINNLGEIVYHDANLDLYVKVEQETIEDEAEDFSDTLRRLKSVVRLNSIKFYLALVLPIVIAAGLLLLIKYY